MNAPPEQRIEHLEAAFLNLCDRVAILERALAFEVAQRESMEAVIMQLINVPKRVDRLERDTSCARKRGAAA